MNNYINEWKQLNKIGKDFGIKRKFFEFNKAYKIKLIQILKKEGLIYDN